MSVVPGQPDPDRQRAIQLYGALGAALVLMIVPLAAAALLSLIMLVVVLVMSSNARRKGGQNSLAENHGVYVARTVWIGSFLASIFLALAAFYLLQTVDNAALQPCMERLMAAAQSGATDVRALEPVVQPCLDEFMKTNMSAMIIAGSICIVPTLLYFGIRFFRGLTRALGGYRLANPKNWLF